jgi:hypothetical protein
MSSAFTALGLNFSEGQIEDVFDLIDNDKNGTLSQ